MNTDLLFENAQLKGRVIALDAEVKCLEAVIRAHERVDCLSVTSLKKQLVEIEAENARLKAEVDRLAMSKGYHYTAVSIITLKEQLHQKHLDYIEVRKANEAKVEMIKSLKAEVERLTKAGDELGEWFMDIHPSKQKWNAAKEGKQS